MRSYLMILCLMLAFTLNAEEFRGWEGLRVILHEGSASHFTVIKSKVKGRQLLCSVNRRQSRIDIYSYVDKDKRKIQDKADQPNELLLPADFHRDEIVLERFPMSLQAADVTGDGYPELYILTSNPVALNRYENLKGNWEKTKSWRLIQEEIAFLPILINDGKAYLSSNQGIMVQDLKNASKAEWLLPAEKNIRRMKWWFVDINKDGEKDLLELVSDAEGGLEFRWKENNNGLLLPSVPLSEISGGAADVDLSGDELVFYLLNSVKRDTVSTYKLALDDESEFGINRLQPLMSMNPSLRTSIQNEDKKVIVELDPSRPQMRVSELTGSGFKELGVYPVIRNVEQVTSVADRGIILFKIKDSADLYVSHWEKGRFTYPKIYKKSADGKRKILGLGRHGHTVWWAQTVDKDLILYKWHCSAESATSVKYEGIGSGLDSALWLGSSHLMVRKKYAKFADYYEIKEGKPVKMASDHLKDASENQFRIYEKGDSLVTARIVDGVIQWLDDKLQTVDQVMLSNGRLITDGILREDGTMLVMGSSGENVSILEKDKSGIMREKEDFEILNAKSLMLDPILGLVMSSNNYLNAPLKGRPWKLDLVHTVDSKLGLPAGVKKASIDRFFLEDVNGDKKPELLNMDYNRHQLTLIAMKEKPDSLASWKIYDDGKYPYSDGGERYAANFPYIMAVLDFDGDGIKEMVMPCHDRLVIYVGKED